MRILTKTGRVIVTLVAVAAAAFPLTPAAATKTICVGLVVDARPLGGQLARQCTTVPDGSTGYDVLRKAGHTVGFRHDGLICTIDNRPADGCGAIDAAHYWAYFHREPGASSWTYSNEGATTYEPENNETEGWVWRDADMAKPPNIPYRTICPVSSSSPSPSPTADRTSKPSPATSGSSDATSVTPRTPTPTTATHSPRPRHRQRPAATTSLPSSSVPTPAARESARTVGTTTAGDDKGSSGPPYALLAGAVAVLGLGGVAAFRWRRRGVE